MKHFGLFEGIGGFSLAAKWMGWRMIGWCEINSFCQQVLKYYFPDAESFSDITKSDFSMYANRVDILTGGFPCQPFSSAGERKGTEDDRHLWPEMLRAIREIRPRWVVGENVRGLTNWNRGMVFDQVQADLEAEGYEVTPFLLPACAVNAPHRRDRIWFVAYSDSNGQYGSNSEYEINASEGWQYAQHDIEPIFGNTEQQRLERGERPQKSEMFESGYKEHAITDTRNKGLQGSKDNRNIGAERKDRNEQFTRCLPPDWQKFPTEPPLCSRNDGVPSELAGITFSKHRNESIKGYGNAIVPQVAYQIFKAIEQYEITK